MRKLSILPTGAFLLAALAGCSFGAGPLGAPASASNPAAQAGYRTLVVQPGAQGELLLAADPEVVHGSFIVKTASGFDKAGFERLGAKVAGTFEMGGFTYWRLEKDSGLAKLVFDLRSVRGVLWAEPELKSSLPPDEGVTAPFEKSLARGVSAETAVFNDPSAISGEYALEITKALDSYKAVAEGGNGYPTTTNPIYVAQIDTGVNMKHYDFWDGVDGNGVGNGTGTSLIAYAKSAFQNNYDGTFTWVGDGQTLVTIPSGENWDDVDHGTHTAGTILAQGNNKVASAGVAWKNTRLISYKCFCDNEVNDAGSGASWSIYGSLKDLTDWWKVGSNHAGQTTIPVNMSLGGSYAGNFELEMINYALANNVLPIVSMGNEGQVKAQYPASYSGVVAVGATNGRDEKVHFSSMGSWISVSAPGYDIVSTSNGEANWNTNDQSVHTGTVWMSGTSMAAPFVTGLVGYLLSFDATLTPDQIKDVLEQTADDKGAVGFDDSFGFGRVNVQAAATAVSTGGISAAGSVFMPTAIRVYIHNTDPNYDSGIPGYTDAVIGQLVTLYDQNGIAVALGQTNSTDGSVEFRLLKAGSYTAKTNYFGSYDETTVTIGSGSDQNISFSYNVPVVLIQTVPNLYWADGDQTGADTMITLYASDGSTVVAGPLDMGTLDTLTVANLTTGTYLVKVEPYSATSLGEYGLNIGSIAKTSVNVAPSPSRSENTSDGYGTSWDTATPVNLNQDYAAYLDTSGEWFSFVLN